MKKNILRGKILALLEKVYPDGADETTIISILYQYHKIEHIRAALEYLSGKGYVEKNQQPHPLAAHEHIRWYKLTPRGVDLLEGNTDPDPGIIVQYGG